MVLASDPDGANWPVQQAVERPGGGGGGGHRGRRDAHRDFHPDAAATERADRRGCPAGSAPVMACSRTVSKGAVAVREVAPAAAPDNSWRQAEPRGDAAPRMTAREVPETRHAAASQCPRRIDSRLTSC